jgi:hypothetical protein
MSTMLFPLLPQTELHGDATFACKRLGQAVQTSACLKWYVDYNALRRTDSPCFKCPQGLKNREDFAKS